MPTVKIQLRRDTAENWELENPVLLDGEFGIVQGTQGTAWKCGDGETAWNDLPFGSGSQGPKGDKGDQGEQGPIGMDGPQGPQGQIGATGPTGPRGERGSDGNSCVVTVVEDTDESYKVSFTVGGSTIISPNLKPATQQATTEDVGVSRFATVQEASAGLLNNVSVTPAGVATAIQEKVCGYATDAKSGNIRISTTSEAAAGVLNNTAMTPKQVADYVSVNVTPQIEELEQRVFFTGFSTRAVSNGATVAGSYLRVYDNEGYVNPNLSGTWKNVTGRNVAVGGVGIFQKVG